MKFRAAGQGEAAVLAGEPKEDSDALERIPTRFSTRARALPIKRARTVARFPERPAQ